SRPVPGMRGLLGALGLGTLIALAGCSTGPRRAPEPPSHASRNALTAAAAGPGAQKGSAASAEPPPARAVADFDRALAVMKAGNAEEAELEFEQIAVSYPRLAAPDIDLGILYRKTGQLDRSEHALREAVHRDGGSAAAWCELGVTLRMLGKFHDAEAAYRQAIAADASFAPAYRDLGVLLDLYLGDAPGALDAFERYRALSGQKEPVGGWIAELRRRAGKGPAPTGPAAGKPGSPTTGKTGD
ncbi:MAG: tetratricopeptide repeat protein, partial [Steroidobacteraceae bacterium]